MARQVLLAAILFALLVASAAKTAVIRPDPCPPLDGPKIIRLSSGATAEVRRIAVYYVAPQNGWASARLLARFNIEGFDMDRVRRHACTPAFFSPSTP